MDCLSRNGVRVMAEQCPTCIFRPGNLMQLRHGRLADICNDAVSKDGYIPCHETFQNGIIPGGKAICRGFWDRYDTTPLQLARRLEFIEEVTMPIGYLARCKKCGEDFNPADENDLIHIERVDGTECGGEGELLGSWT